ncbi:Histone-lysine N-methyltransferase set9 [Penicillium capsulatum]|uniref:Histone-lysine N-methyltransferase SET9 n=1 Tax=Penicillium capsulatum TaxID=69766 RepID=A0A9W9I7L3_9EURO|nr:Histone-lysine N-methyltransferase set9 [Penicillium capsulatum]
MPPKKARSASPASKRRERLTLDKLASYDDVATDALIDHAYFWTTTRKNRNKYGPARGIHDDEVGRIILHDVVVDKDVPEAERKLLALPGLKKYLATLRTSREKEWFCRHLRKYIQMYHPDSPFEVTTTNRYIITEHEAAICARKFIKAGQEIKYLSGTLVTMTKEEEGGLGLTRKDFSVVMSSRRKAPSFFLGPARFANHDCDANGRLVTRGNEGMSVMATRNIRRGEEITVSYGEDYFGIDNCECLCLTCERAVRNGWAPKQDSDANRKESTPTSIDEAVPSETPRKGRKRRRESDRTKLPRTTSKLREEISMSELSNESTETPEADIPPTPDSTLDSGAMATTPTVGSHQSKVSGETKTSEVTTPKPEMTSDRSLLPSTVGTDQSEVKQNGQLAGHGEDPLPNGTNTAINTLAHASTGYCDSPSSTTGESHLSPVSSVTSVDESGLQPRAKASAKTDENNSEVTKLEGLQDVPARQSVATSRPISRDNEDASSELTEPPEEPDARESPAQRTPRRYKKRNWHVVASVETVTPTVRSPGDYTKTSRLLGQKYDRWVECQTCDSWFVQSNSYQTRRECPRCERHSKLYGFQWPHTDESPDGDDRVMDHRMIHRFLSPDSEARVSRRDRGVSFGITPTPELSDARTDTDSSDAQQPRHGTRSSRRLARELRMTM